MSARADSFWWGGYEGADHLNHDGVPLDMVRSTGHLDLLEADHARAAALGFSGVRESIGWRLAEPEPGRFDLERAKRMATSARAQGLQVLWTLMHYGTPADIDLFDDRMIDRFAAFCAEVATVLAPLHDAPPVYNLVNEIGFISWAVSATNQFAPYWRSIESDTEVSGYEVKRRLVSAVLAGMEAVRLVDPRACFLHVEPLVHVVAPSDRPELGSLAARIGDYQWQVWDLLSGRLEPELGGSDDALGLLGINYYHAGQWEAVTEQRLSWFLRDRRRRPFGDLLQDVWQRYRRPMMVAETSHVGRGRGRWLDEAASEVRRVRQAGIPVSGICLYPLVDRHDWDDRTRWHHSGLWDADAPDPLFDSKVDPPAHALARRLCTDYAASLRQWQQHLPYCNPGTDMPTLIVFSHLRWNFVWQRPQQLMSRLAQQYRVLFVEEPVYQPDGDARLDRIPQGPTLDVLVPCTPVPMPGFHDEQLPVLKPLLADYLRHHGIDDYLVWFYTPMALPLIDALRPRAVVYDCMDELSAFKDAPRQLRQRETALMKIAGLVITGGPALYEAKKSLHENVHCLPSAVDAAHFAPDGAERDAEASQEAAALQQAIGHPRLGFFGVIDERFDVGLVSDLARRRPHWHFVMVGPVVKIDPGLLPGEPNIHWLGMQPYALLPHLMAGWDVCLMPFALNESTRFISPTKTLEYLAGGKPVVSTAVRDVITLYGDVVRIGRTPDEFLEAVEMALAESAHDAPTREARLSARRAKVALHSWDSSADTVRALLAQTSVKPPMASHVQLALAGLVTEKVVEPEQLSANAPDGGLTQAVAPLAPAAHRSSRSVRHLIIGAGPTGLSAAYHLEGGSAKGDVMLVEREETVGGWCRSVKSDGFTWDYAGHIMFSNDAHVLALYQRLLGANVHWQNREAWIYSKQVYTRYPFQGSLYGLPPQVLKECIVGAIEARFGSLDGSKAQPVDLKTHPPANFQEFIERVWGKGISVHFATPYNRKVWALPLEDMETSWLGGRVPLPDLAQVIEGALEPTPAPMGPNARFGYPLQGGFQALMEGFLPLLDCEMSMKTAVLQVSPSTRTVRLDDGRVIRFESLISTMPLPRLIEVCGDEAPANVRAAARALRHVSVRCVNLGIGLAPRQERLTEKHWIYYPEDTVFHRIFVQGNASPHCNPPGGFALTCEITYGPNKPLPCDGDALIERCIADCRRVGMFNADAPVLSANQVDMPLAYVIYDHARAANVARIREWVGSFGIILAGRYAEWEYYNSDHAFLAGKRAAEESVAARAGALELAQAG